LISSKNVEQVCNLLVSFTTQAGCQPALRWKPHIIAEFIFHQAFLCGVDQEPHFPGKMAGQNNSGIGSSQNYFSA
jgi:hypothetical protein